MIEAVAFLAPKLHELNDNKIILLKDKYPCLRTRRRNIINWWNSLVFLEKLDVGAVAVHYRKMTPNYKWMCYDEQKWEHLTKGQQKIVKFVFSKRNDNWYMFDIASMLRL